MKRAWSLTVGAAVMVWCVVAMRVAVVPIRKYFCVVGERCIYSITSATSSISRLLLVIEVVLLILLLSSLLDVLALLIV